MAIPPDCKKVQKSTFAFPGSMPSRPTSRGHAHVNSTPQPPPSAARRLARGTLACHVLVWRCARARSTRAPMSTASVSLAVYRTCRMFTWGPVIARRHRAVSGEHTRATREAPRQAPPAGSGLHSAFGRTMWGQSCSAVVIGRALRTRGSRVTSKSLDETPRAQPVALATSTSGTA